MGRKQYLEMRVFVGLTSLSLLTSVAHAQLIASDSYAIGSNLAAGQYPANTALSNATILGTAGVSGLTTPGFLVGRYGAGSGTAQFSATSSGLSYAPLGADGTLTGKVTYAATGLDNTIRSTARNLSPAAPAGSTYWMSMLLNRGAVGAGTGRNYVMAGFGGTANPTLASELAGQLTGPGLFVGYSGNEGNLALRYRDNGGTAAWQETVLASGAGTALDNVTNAVVIKVQLNTAGVTDSVSWWLNPIDFTSETTLTSSSANTGTIANANAFSSSADLVRLNYSSRNWNGSAFFDELRLSQDLNGLGGLGVIPEPGTLALLGVGALPLLLRRRKK